MSESIYAADPLVIYPGGDEEALRAAAAAQKSAARLSRSVRRLDGQEIEPATAASILRSIARTDHAAMRAGSYGILRGYIDPDASIPRQITVNANSAQSIARLAETEFYQQLGSASRKTRQRLLAEPGLTPIHGFLRRLPRTPSKRIDRGVCAPVAAQDQLKAQLQTTAGLILSSAYEDWQWPKRRLTETRENHRRRSQEYSLARTGKYARPLAACLEGIVNSTILSAEFLDPGCSGIDWQLGEMGTDIAHTDIATTLGVIESASADYRAAREILDRGGANDLLALSVEDAYAVVSSAFSRLSPKAGEIVERAIRERRIDSVRRSTARTWLTLPLGRGEIPFVSASEPYTINNVVALGHELGHVVHITLAACQPLGSDSYDPVITEVMASIGEMITLDELRNRLPEHQHALNKLELKNWCNSVFLCGVEARAELAMHQARSEGTVISPELLDEIWGREMRGMEGPGKPLPKGYERGWTAAAHWASHPLWSWTYPFAALTSRAIAENCAGPGDFSARVIRLMSSGNSRPAAELLQGAGVKADDPRTWEKALQTTSRLIGHLAPEKTLAT